MIEMMSKIQQPHISNDAHTRASNESVSAPASDSTQSPPEQSVKTVLGWTFFDPCNLLSLLLLSSAAILSFNEMRQISLSHTWVVLLYYGCIAALLRGYFYSYYYGGKLARVLIFTPLLLGVLAGSAYWSDASKGFAYLSEQTLKFKGASDAFYWASLLNTMCSIGITVHLLMPRRWLVRITDDIENRVPDDLGASMIKVQDTVD